MYILFFSHYFPPEGNAPASRTYGNCKRWVRDGHKVTVITCAPNCPSGVLYEGYVNKLYSRETVEGINVIRVWTYIAANKGTMRRIINYASYMFSAVFTSLFLKKPDVIIATSPQFFCGWAGIIAGKLKRCPIILEIRDIWPDSIVAVGAMRSKWLLRFVEYLEKKMYAAAQHIVTVGEGYRKQLINKGVEEKRISVIPNGVDLGLFSPKKPNMRLKASYGLGREFVCSYIGTIGMACGLNVVLRGAQILKKKKRHNIVFLLIGDGAVKDRLQQKAREQDLENVLFVGRKDKKLIPDFLSITDACLIHLKKTELFKSVLPSKIFEAVAMAKPIILGVEGYAAGLVTEMGAGICFEPENAEQLVQVVETLADNRKLCATLGKRGYEYAVKYFNRDDLAEAYLNIIKVVLPPISTSHTATAEMDYCHETS